MVSSVLAFCPGLQAILTQTHGQEAAKVIQKAHRDSGSPGLLAASSGLMPL